MTILQSDTTPRLNRARVLARYLRTQRHGYYHVHVIADIMNRINNVTHDDNDYDPREGIVDTYARHTRKLVIGSTGSKRVY